MTPYRPTPLDTSGVTMTTGLHCLVERLAENAHDTWAARRMSTGWRYGPERDDKARRHPCLVPYAELPEDEKEYDRQMVAGTARAILSLGYEIRRRDPMTDERVTLKTEQLERIKQRDTFLNLNIVALGVVTAIAVQGQNQAAAWLVVPWLTAIMGWAYLSNDDKVTAIARHLKTTLDTRTAALSWEAGQKGLLPSWVRRLAEVVVFLLSFVLPTPIAIALYATAYPGTWAPITLVVAIFEAIVTACLCAVYTLSVIRRR